MDAPGAWTFQQATVEDDPDDRTMNNDPPEAPGDEGVANGPAEDEQNGANDEQDGAVPPQQPGQISVTFEDAAGAALTFKLKPTTSMKKAMDAYSARMEKDRKTLRFLFDGDRVLVCYCLDGIFKTYANISSIRMSTLRRAYAMSCHVTYFFF
jgi:hypothetical protein